MSAHTKVPWTAIGSLVFKGSDCIGIFDTDNASEERYVANAHICALAVNSHDGLVEALENARRSMIISVTGISNGLTIHDRIWSWIEQADAALAAANPKPGA